VGACGLVLSAVAVPAQASGAETVRLEGSQAVLPGGIFAQTPVPPDDRVAIQVQLRLRDQAGADALALSVSTPGSPDYRRYLTAEEFRARFAPTDATVADVSAWLTSQGLTVTSVPANHLYIAAEGTAAQVEAAFAIGLATIEVNGGQRRVNTAEPAVPAELAAAVDGVTGLTEVLAHPTRVGGGAEMTPTTVSSPAAGPSAGMRTAGPCSKWWGEDDAAGLPRYGSGYGDPLAWAPCGWTPPELRRAYGVDGLVDSGVDGSGVRVAVVGAYLSPTLHADASTYARRNDPAHPLPRRRLVEQAFLPEQLQTQCGIGGWYGEQTLDVEAVHAMAPGATILAVGARSCTDPDLLEAITAVVDDHQADIVSNSYGFQGELLPEASVRATLRVHTQAAIQGIGFMYSTGDDGDWSSDGSFVGPLPSANFPSSSPLATAVGGTSLGLAEDGSVALERGWTTGTSTFDPATRTFTPGGQGEFMYGAGGGPSRLFDQPRYQAGIVPNGMAGALGAPRRRVSPDVGMVGDPNTGMLVGQTQTFPEGVSYDEYRIGGTSLSSPLFAGVMALADQRAGTRHGFANPWLYSLAASPALRDIAPGPRTAVVRRNFVNGVDSSGGFTAPTVRTIDADLQSLRTLAGYDTLTGLGAPAGARFVNAG
jgi:subtilase family serine protease